MTDSKNTKPSDELPVVDEQECFEVIELDDDELDHVAGSDGNCGCHPTMA